MPKLRAAVVDVIREARLVSEKGISLQLRLFSFFLLFLVIMTLEALLALFAFGVFSKGQNEARRWMEKELDHIAHDISENFGKLSVDGVALSKKLSGHLEEQLEDYGIKPSDLEAHPEILTDLLSDSFDYLQIALEKNKFSGAFLILDATINPSLPDAGHSRAGLYLKNMDPSVASPSLPIIHYRRGPMSVVRGKESVYILPQWRMEFKTTLGDMFDTVINTARDSKLPLSRLYYWNGRPSLEESYEQNIFLCVPLVAKNGTIMGVCGFDVDAMLFKLQYTPENTTYSKALAVLAPLTDDGFNASSALFAGKCSASPSCMNGVMSVYDGNFNEFCADDGVKYSGLYREIVLYPKDSAYAGNRWALAVMMPKEDLDAYISARKKPIVMLITLLFLLSIAAAALISRRYLSPLYEALRMLKEKNAAKYTKTRIPEIDDLIEFLNTQDAARKEKKQPKEVPPTPASGMLDAFIMNVGTLSPAEKVVFNLYLAGHSASEIADILNLSINTIKTHNKRIYMKLDITSRKELNLYVEMMKEMGSVELVK